MDNINEHAAVYNSAQFNSGRGLNDVGVMVDKMQGELDKKLFDAMEVTFRVSSPHPLHNPYIVIVAQYHEQQEKPGVAHNWIFAAQLDPIDNEPRRIRILRGGLPLGFELEKFQVHLYDHGNEIATNVADKRVPLTKDEAFEYVLIDYLGHNKGATLPPAPAMGRLPPGFYTWLVNSRLQSTYFVKVDKTGRVTEAFFDEACQKKIDDPYLADAITHLLFKPALENGKPIDAVARLNLHQLPFPMKEHG